MPCLASIFRKNQYTGQESDLAETGLYYYGARYYDPAIGRFITADSIVQDPGDPQSFNRYSYVRNNPLRYVDPTGHDCECYEYDDDTGECIDLECDPSGTNGGGGGVGNGSGGGGGGNGGSSDWNSSGSGGAAGDSGSSGYYGYGGGYDWIGSGATDNIPEQTYNSCGEGNYYSGFLNVGGISINPGGINIDVGYGLGFPSSGSSGISFGGLAQGGGNSPASGVGNSAGVTYNPSKIDWVETTLAGISSISALVALAPAAPPLVRGIAGFLGGASTISSVGYSIYRYNHSRGRMSGMELSLSISLDLTPFLGSRIAAGAGKAAFEVIEHQVGLGQALKSIFYDPNE